MKLMASLPTYFTLTIKSVVQQLCLHYYRGTYIDCLTRLCTPCSTSPPWPWWAMKSWAVLQFTIKWKPLLCQTEKRETIKLYVIFCTINHYPILMDVTNHFCYKIQHNLFDHLMLGLLTLFSRHTGLDWADLIISQQNRIDHFELTMIVIQISYWRGIKLPSWKIIKTVICFELGKFSWKQ